MKNNIIHIIIFLLLQTVVISQVNEVNECLKLVSEGKSDEAKIKLPELLAKYPDDEAVKFLHAVVLEDGSLAVAIYKNIISKNTNSPWADKSYLRIIQYNAIIGDTTEAKIWLNNYKKNFPDSEFLSLATDALKVSAYQLRKESKKEILTEESSHSEKLKINDENKTGETKDLPETQDLKKDVKTKGQFGLQVGIYSTQTAAKNEAAKYTKLRMVANIIPKMIGNETMYAVVIGEYKDRKMAENAKPLVTKNCNCIPLIIEK